MADVKSDASDATEIVEVEASEEYNSNDQIGEDELVTEQAYDEVAEHYEEERHSSMSSRLLTWLLFLLAGAGLALWGGPKIAPQLPAWAAPAAKYLTPGGDAALQDVAALRTEVTERLEAAPAVPTQEEIAELVKSEASTFQADTQAKLAELEEKLNSTDASGMEARVATLESQIEGLSTEVTALTDSVQTSMAQGGTISEETLAEITSKSAEVEGIRAQVGEISTQVSTLTQRLEDNEMAANARLEEAKAEAERAQEEAEQVASAASYQEALDKLAESVEAGAPYATELEKFSNVSGQEIPAVLLDNATDGITSVSTLKGQFADLSHQAIRASIKAEAAESGNPASKFGAFLKSQVAARSLEASDGDGTDAILSRVDVALTNGDLATVSEEASALSEEARAPLADWLSAIEARKTVIETLATFASHPS